MWVPFSDNQPSNIGDSPANFYHSGYKKFISFTWKEMGNCSNNRFPKLYSIRFPNHLWVDGGITLPQINGVIHHSHSISHNTTIFKLLFNLFGNSN